MSSSAQPMPSAAQPGLGARIGLAFARIVILAATALALVFFLASIGAYFVHISTVCHSANCINDQLPVSAVDLLAKFGAPLVVYAAAQVVLQSVYVLVTLAVALILIWRRPHDGFALFTALTLIAWLFFVADAPSILADSNPAWGVVLALYSLASFPCFTYFFLAFPAGGFASARSRWLAIGFAALMTVAFGVANFGFGQAPAAFYLVVFALWFGVLIGAQVYRYRHISTSVQRQQTKWVVYGLAVSLLGFVIVLTVQVVTGGFESSPLGGLLNGLYYVFELLAPLSIGFAILRYHLFEIDVIIKRTLVYGSMTVILAALYFGLIAGAQTIIHAVTGQQDQPPVVIVLSTLLIAALVQPLRLRIQTTIDQRFYRSKYDAARTLEAFGATLRSEVELRDLSANLLAVVEETMQPERVSLWLRPQTERREGGGA